MEVTTEIFQSLILFLYKVGIKGLMTNLLESRLGSALDNVV